MIICIPLVWPTIELDAHGTGCFFLYKSGNSVLLLQKHKNHFDCEQVCNVAVSVEMIAFVVFSDFFIFGCSFPFKQI